MGDSTSATYLITGGSGSLGTALTHTLLAQGHKVRAMARNEHRIAALVAGVPATLRDNLSAMCGDVRSPSRLRLAFRDVDYVIHAAAMKSVPQCEYDPGEAVLTNVQGTINVALACVEAGVKRAVFISSDKACSPHNLYGMTKAVGERVWLASNRYSAGVGCEFVAVRYGNVGGSNGSVIRKWLQLDAVDSLVLTDPECTRFHLRLSSAVDLVLSVLREGRAGSLYVPLLPSYRLKDLAKAVNPEAAQKVTGLSPGEKLHECMVNEHEASHAVMEPIPWVDQKWIRIDPALKGEGVKEYTSGGNTWRLTVEELRKEIAWLKQS